MSSSTILALLIGGGVILYALLHVCLRLEDRAMRWLSRGSDHATLPEPDAASGNPREIVTEDGSIDLSNQAHAADARWV